MEPLLPTDDLHRLADALRAADYTSTAIAERIVGGGHMLLVTRAQPEANDAVRLVVPDAVYHADARAISYRQGEIPAGRGTVLVACASLATDGL